MPRKTRLVSVYLTAKDMQEADKIRDALLKNRLAACVNTIAKIDSCFWWEGRMRSCEEVGLIAKSRAALVKKIVKKVKEIHSDSVPCIVAWPIIGGNQDYLEWVERETK